MCDSCNINRGPSTIWLRVRAAVVIGASVISAIVLVVAPGAGRSADYGQRRATTDRVFVSDMSRQRAAGLALAAAGARSSVPRVRRLANTLAGLEADHPATDDAPAGTKVRSGRPFDQRAFAAAVGDHVQADLLIARIERSEGADRALRGTAASFITRARPALAMLSGI